MWKTRQRADPCLRAECDSTHSDVGRAPFCTHTSAAWLRDLPSVRSNCANWLYADTFSVVTTCLSMRRGFSVTLRPPTRSHTHNTVERHHPCAAAMNEHQGHFSNHVNKQPSTLSGPRHSNSSSSFPISRCDTRGIMRRTNRSLIITRSQPQRTLSSDSSDTLAPSSVMYVSDNLT